MRTQSIEGIVSSFPTNQARAQAGSENHFGTLPDNLPTTRACSSSGLGGAKGLQSHRIYHVHCVHVPLRTSTPIPNAHTNVHGHTELGEHYSVLVPYLSHLVGNAQTLTLTSISMGYPNPYSGRPSALHMIRPNRAPFHLVPLMICQVFAPDLFLAMSGFLGI